MTPRLLIVDDESGFVALLSEKFKDLGWEVISVLTVSDAVKAAEKAGPISHCILDLNVAHVSGLSVIPRLLDRSPNCKIVILTGYASVQTTIEAIKLGAIYLLSKPSRFSDILNAFEHQPNPNQVRLDAHAKSGIAQKERETIQQALEAHHYNVSKTADFLGMHRRTLQRKLRKLL